MPDPDLSTMLESWALALGAQRKSPQTIRAYTIGVAGFLAWCESTGTPPRLTRGAVNGYIVSLLDSGQAAATAVLRHRAVRQFARWLVAEGELAADPLAGMSPPQLDQPLVPYLSDDEIRDLLAACSGKGFRDRRDEAIVRLMLDTTARAEEVTGMRVADVDMKRLIVTITRGKGGKGRIAPFSPGTAVAVDRYLRLRRGHRYAGSPAMWLGQRGGGFGYPGLYQALLTRARAAGIEGFHPHRIRHSAASRWLASGGSEGGLMAVAGWRNREMISRYTADTAADRAVEEFRRLPIPEL